MSLGSVSPMLHLHVPWKCFTYHFYGIYIIWPLGHPPIENIVSVITCSWSHVFNALFPFAPEIVIKSTAAVCRCIYLRLLTPVRWLRSIKPVNQISVSTGCAVWICLHTSCLLVCNLSRSATTSMDINLQTFLWQFHNRKDNNFCIDV